MVLQEDFTYCDPSGQRWTSPSGATIDGASIPRPAWSPAGSPFVGDYRRASVIHDYYCITKDRPWQKVHRVFYDAMRASGVGIVQAKIFYAAVYQGGPRWQSLAGAEPGTVEIIDFPVPKFDNTNYTELDQWVRDVAPSLDDIDRHVQEILMR